MNPEDRNRQDNLVAVLKDVLHHLRQAEAQLDTASHYLSPDSLEIDGRVANWVASVRTASYELEEYLESPADSNTIPASWIEDAALASEMFGDDELERWAELYPVELFDEELLELVM